MACTIYPITNDIIFKSIFGREAHTPILIPMMNAVLGYSPGERITQADILTPFRFGEGVKSRSAVLDIHVKDGRGWRYNIEMQARYETGYLKRALFYLNGLYCGQLVQSDLFDTLQRTVGISFVSFDIFPDTLGFHNRFRLKSLDKDFSLDIQELHMLELSKFHGKLVESLTTPLEKWLHVLKFSLKYAKITTEIPAVLKEEEGIDMAIRAYRKTLADPDVQYMMHLREKAEHIEAGRLADAMKEGLAKGRTEGRTEGKVEGEIEKARNIARKLLLKGMEREEVKSITGLSDGEMEEV